MINIGVLASGNGSNFEALVKAERKGYFKAKIKLLITDREDAFVRIRAKKLGVKEIYLPYKKYSSRYDFDREIVKILKREKIKLVVLAGYMRILTPYFVNSFKNRILNIHPALLPAFKGVNAIERAFNYGVKITGVTIHFVDEKVDHGPIIIQDAVKIKENMNLKDLEEKIHRLEHKLYPKAIKLLVEKKVRIRGRYVEIIDKI